MISLFCIGGPHHGQAQTLEDHHRQWCIATRKPFEPVWHERPLPDDHDKLFAVERYYRQRFRLDQTKRTVDYLVHSSVEPKDALKLVAEFEDAPEVSTTDWR